MMFLIQEKNKLTGFRMWRLVWVFVALVLFNACTEEEETWEYDGGAFVVNEGQWSKSNASVSYLASASGSVEKNLFSAANGKGKVLGDLLMDLDVVGDEVYMILNASNNIQVVEKSNFEWLATIEGLSNPRYALSYNGKLYVSQWGIGVLGSVAVIDLETKEVEETIEVGAGPEGLMVHNGQIWVANSGGYGRGNSVMVIDPSANLVAHTIEVGDGPQQLVADANGAVWAVCYGYVSYNWDPPYNILEETASQLVRINTESKTVDKTITIHAMEHPSSLEISPDGQTLYVGGGYTYHGIYAVSITSDGYPAEPLSEGFYYGFSVNPANGDIYGCQAPTFFAPITARLSW
jgi:YVTN family beta-propeller protein